jgi:hypothetical protein
MPHVGESLGLLVTIIETLNVSVLKIGFASVVKERRGTKGRG